MKRNLFLAGLLLISVFATMAQTKEAVKKAEYNVISEDRNIASFETIDISGRFLVKLYPSSTPAITVTAADEYISFVETNVENGVLKINMRNLTSDKNVNIIDGLKNKYNDYLIRQPIEIRVGVVNLNQILVKGVTTVETESILKLQNLYLNISDASKANLKIDIASGFSAAISGASKVELSGRTVNSDINISGASSLEGKDFQAKNSKVVLSGASRAEMHVTENLDAELKGATRLVCSGSPKSIKQNASRGSSIVIK